ncbi:hypothetical protein AB7714_28355 [Tardiphaga sp. 1201_B9_N1_1]|uniref:hypothetical protein n=1 Tax=unclassified Tardiphaga TaxID=2631404 RepID=UPI003F1F8280
MDDPVAAVMVGGWSLLTEQAENGLYILSFEFSDKPPINLAMSRNDAETIGRVLLEQVEHDKFHTKKPN